MADRIPHNFTETAPQLVNFSFTDFASGAGYVVFYLGATTEATAAKNRLSTTTFYADKINHESAAANDGTFTELLDLDFDVEFLRTVTIEGKAIFSLPLGIRSGTANADLSWYAIVKVRKVSGGAETDLVSSQGTTFNDSNISANIAILALSAINANIPKTSFKVGDSLRITVGVWAKRGASSADYQVVLCADPKGRTISNLDEQEIWDVGTAVTIDWSGEAAPVTIALAQIPFRTTA